MLGDSDSTPTIDDLRRVFADFEGLREDERRLSRIMEGCRRLLRARTSELVDRLLAASGEQALDVLLEIGVGNEIIRGHPNAFVEYEPGDLGASPPDFRVATTRGTYLLEIKRVRVEDDIVRDVLIRACEEQLSGLESGFIDIVWMDPSIERSEVQQFVQWLARHAKQSRIGGYQAWPTAEDAAIEFQLRPGGTDRGLVIGTVAIGGTRAGLAGPLDVDAMVKKMRRLIRKGERKAPEANDDDISVLVVQSKATFFDLKYVVDPLLRDKGLLGPGNGRSIAGIMWIDTSYHPFMTPLEGRLVRNPERPDADKLVGLFPGIA